MSKPGIPQGTRDFGPEQMARRNYIFDTIRDVFQRYGFLPIETPAMETLQTLLGKYGEEGDKLIFRILKRGEKLAKVLTNEPTEMNVADNALRYDLTVPFARFVVMHQNDLAFPFKRYQIQPVWRADRPGKGRYREFYQCDVDTIGSDSLLNEVELIQIIDEVFEKLQLPDVSIQLNNRKVLAGIAEVVGEAGRIVDITVAMDKLDKIGIEKVNDEMLAKGVSQDAVHKLQPIILLEGSNSEKLAKIRLVLADSEVGQRGLDELETIFRHTDALGINNVALNLTLARGLNYYTGAIFEVTHPEFKSSITGGGRYDDLTGIFGLPNVSGVGISFGADRIYDLLAEKNLFPASIASSTDVMFINFGPAEAAYCINVASKLRAAGISTEVYPDAAKMQKQMKYANRKNIGHVVLVGSREMESGELTVKDMASGEQHNWDVATMLAELRKKLN